MPWTVIKGQKITIGLLLTLGGLIITFIVDLRTNTFDSPTQKHEVISAAKKINDSKLNSGDAYELKNGVDTLAKTVWGIKQTGNEWREWRRNIDSTLEIRSDIINRTAVTAYQSNELSEDNKRLANENKHISLEILKRLEKLDSTLRVLHPNHYNFREKIKNYPRIVRSNGGLVEHEEFLTEEMQVIFNEFKDSIK